MFSCVLLSMDKNMYFIAPFYESYNSPYTLKLQTSSYTTTFLVALLLNYTRNGIGLVHPTKKEKKILSIIY